jgi:hypothetical protein
MRTEHAPDPVHLAFPAVDRDAPAAERGSVQVGAVAASQRPRWDTRRRMQLALTFSNF